MTIEQFDKMIAELEELVQGLYNACDKLNEASDMAHALNLSIKDSVAICNSIADARCEIVEKIEKIKNQIKYLNDRKDKEFDLVPFAEFFADSPKDYTITEVDHKELAERFSFYEKEC